MFWLTRFERLICVILVAADIRGICDSASWSVMSGSTPEADSVTFLEWKKNGWEKF